MAMVTNDKGIQIQCTCKSLFLDRVKKLQVGQWRYLENFLICSATGIYRPTSHKFKILITADSIVTKSEDNTCKVPLIDHTKESSSEDISTPFSKRKEVDADLKEMNSTSKKLCVKNNITEKRK
ncbi:DUF223 domain-containing protein [Raphanus sativus]|nr:DUF223 domain-containing protein [Raphanus sativus]